MPCSPPDRVIGKARHNVEPDDKLGPSEQHDKKKKDKRVAFVAAAEAKSARPQGQRRDARPQGSHPRRVRPLTTSRNYLTALAATMQFWYGTSAASVD